MWHRPGGSALRNCLLLALAMALAARAQLQVPAQMILKQDPHPTFVDEAQGPPFVVGLGASGESSSCLALCTRAVCSCAVRPAC